MQTPKANGRPARPSTIGVKNLMAQKFEAVRYVVPGYVAEGCTLLVGAPKLGKSWLCLEIALAVAGGGQCLGGIECEQGDVLYLALEDNERRLQSRVNTIWSREAQARLDLPAGLEFATRWNRADQEGIADIRAWLDEHPRARLVIVDVLAAFKPLGRKRDQQLYDADYSSLRDLQQLAAEKGVAIIVVHHTRKSTAEIDPFDAISGTLGLSGAADTALILRRDANGSTLYGRGRDIEEVETALEFDAVTCRWRALGAVAEVRRSTERAQIIELLADASLPMKPAEIAKTIGKSGDAVRQLLSKMAKGGEVERVDGGYIHPDHTGHASHRISTPTPGNSGYEHDDFGE